MIKSTIEQVCECFPKAEWGRLYFSKVNLLLEQACGFTPGNTRFAEGGCCDEINEPELRQLQLYWGERFKFGGLAGYPHGGKSALGTVSHHVPEEEGKKNLLLVTGPHIGFHDGEWGCVPREGQSEITTSCSALMAILSAGAEGMAARKPDPLDPQMETLVGIMKPFLQENGGDDGHPAMVRATHSLMQRVDEDFSAMVESIQSGFGGQIAIVTGVTINTAIGNLFCPSMQEVWNQDLGGERGELTPD